MPIFEYVCERCGFKKEKILYKKNIQYKDFPFFTFCPNCKRESYFSIKPTFKSNFVLKGNCWAKDGYS